MHISVSPGGITRISLVLALFATTWTPLMGHAGLPGFSAGVADISRNIRRQVRHALRPRLVVDQKQKRSINSFMVSPDGRYVSVMVPGEILLWDARLGSLLMRRTLLTAAADKLAFSSGNTTLGQVDAQGNVQLTDLLSAAPAASRLPDVSRATALAYQAQGDAWLSGTSGGTVVISPGTPGKPGVRLALDDGPVCCIKSLADSPLAVAGGRSRLTLLDSSGTGRIVRTWNLNSPVLSIQVSPSEKLVGVTTPDRYYLINPSAAGILWSQRRPASSRPVGLYRDRWFAIEGNNTIRRYDPYSGDSSTFELKDFETNPLQSVSLGGKTMALTTGDGLGYLVDLEQERITLRWIVTEAGWTVVDDKGRFDGFAEGVRAVAWEAGTNKVQLAGFAQPYYEPGLLGKALGRQGDAEFLSAADNAVSEGVYLPPKAELDMDHSAGPAGRARIRVALSAESAEDAAHITAAALYQNGKALSGRHLYNVAKSNAGRRVEWTYEVALTDGENLFFADLVADNGIRSRSDVVSLSYRESVNVPGTQHVHSIGINRYASDAMVLDYSVADALAMADKFTNEVAPSSRATSEVVKVDGNASSASIRATLADLRKLRPSDTAVLYLSGHGVVVDGEWYFMPQESQSLSDAEHIKQVGISGAELSAALVEAPAQRIFLAIDACQSGAVVDSFSVFKQRKVLQQLSDNAGVHILTATRADQLAPEFAQLGHGLFTYVMLQGMTKEKGYYKADRSPRDGHLSVEELKQYVIEQSPIVTIRLLTALLGKSKTTRGIEDLNVVVSPAQLSTGSNFLFN